MKNYTIAIALVASGVIGTATYYEANEVPVLPETSVRYEKVNEDMAYKYTLIKEAVYASKLFEETKFMDERALEFSKELDLEGRFKYANDYKLERVKELEILKNSGVLKAEEYLSQIQK